MDRRTFLCRLMVGTLSAPLAAEAQAGKVPRVGFVSPPPHAPEVLLEALRQGLRDLGYIEGQNVQLEVRQWDGISGHSASLVAELIRLPVDVLVVPTTGDVLAAK